VITAGAGFVAAPVDCRADFGMDFGADFGVFLGVVWVLGVLRVVGAVVTGAGPGTLQAPVLADVGRNIGSQTTTAPISRTPITVSAGQ